MRKCRIGDEGVMNGVSTIVIWFGTPYKLQSAIVRNETKSPEREGLPIIWAGENPRRTLGRISHGTPYCMQLKAINLRDTESNTWSVAFSPERINTYQLCLETHGELNYYGEGKSARILVHRAFQDTSNRR